MPIVVLGQTVRDKLTGLTGTVVARTEWLYGCVRLTVQPHGVKDGKPFDFYTFDEPQAEVLEADTLLAVEAAEKPYNHGPREDAPRQADPR